MTPSRAMESLAADLAQHDADTQTLGYERNLMLVSREAVRAIVLGNSEAEMVGGGKGESTSGSATGDQARSAWGDPALRGVTSAAQATVLPSAAQGGDGADRTGPHNEAATALGDSPSGSGHTDTADTDAPAPLSAPRRCGEYGAAEGSERVGDQDVPAVHRCMLEAGHAGLHRCHCSASFEGERPF